MREKPRKETSSSKKSANGPEKISVYANDVKDPSKYIGPIKVLFHISHPHSPTHAPGGNSVVLNVFFFEEPIMCILSINSVLPRELAFTRPKHFFKKSGFSFSVVNTKLQKLKRRFWSTYISS
ncbi:hypothetical protein TNCV_5068891 [Trichonephila clavipes]|nr:hypothetical protein TNCV_5068891 [Trichonephila clavipes]